MQRDSLEAEDFPTNDCHVVQLPGGQANAIPFELTGQRMVLDRALGSEEQRGMAPNPSREMDVFSKAISRECGEALDGEERATNE